MNLQQRLEAAANRLREIRGMESVTDEIRSEAAGLLTTMGELRAQIAEMQAQDAALASFDEARATSRGRASANDSVASAREEEARSEQSEVRSIGDIITDNDEFRAWSANPGGRSYVYELSEEEYRAAGIVNTAILPADYLRPQVLPGFRRESNLYGSLRDVLLVGQTSADSLLFFRELGFTNAAEFVAEATATAGASGLKPESGLSFEQDTATIGTIAHWMAVTNQLERNAPELRSIVNERLLEGLNLTEDVQLLTGTGTPPDPTGLLETADIQVLDNTYFGANPTQNAGTEAEPFDRLARAKRLITDVARSRASFIVFNPEDDEYFQTIMDANGHYYGGGPYVSGVASRFWGLPRIVNENMPQGQALVGDGRQAQIWDRMSARVTVGLVNDQFIRNMHTVLAEKEVGLAVYRPEAFALVDLFA